ncbi:cysteinyl-tRNA synthetase [Burkholderia thailandensis]|uniref:CysS/YqeB C-terminal domain-containing protein n=1 Tax=Burkholderia thailandensis TaxID=57975 RepID=UPI00016A6965|nr:cysteinyl-tRNA synthetase [Burkholderia thailandensis]AJT48918.1 cysteinyl-tRNA synthetase [Burkholderia thailandensis]AOI55268.1 cysteinyl-tRNA synthetase [Burkholderia thailandensis]
MNEDLNLPRALAVLRELVESSLPPSTLRATVDGFDTVPSLGLRDWKPVMFDIPESVRALLGEREQDRAERNWAKADDIRRTLSARGWRVEGSKEGQRLIGVAADPTGMGDGCASHVRRTERPLSTSSTDHSGSVAAERGALHSACRAR